MVSDFAILWCKIAARIKVNFWVSNALDCAVLGDNMQPGESEFRELQLYLELAG